MQCSHPEPSSSHPHNLRGATVVAGRWPPPVTSNGAQVSPIRSCRGRTSKPYAVIRGESDGMATWLINLPPAGAM